MFAKPYKIKSVNSLKNSEKKHLIQRIVDSFPLAGAEAAASLVPARAPVACLRLLLASGEVVGVYSVSNVPVMLEIDNTLVPALPALWKVPDLVHTLTIHTPVLAKMQGGAPLYLPGVALPAQGLGFPLFARGAVLALRTADSPAAVAVGWAAMNSADMLLRVGGKCLETVHVAGDLLSQEPRLEGQAVPRAMAGAGAGAGAGEDAGTARGGGDEQDAVAAEMDQLCLEEVAADGAVDGLDSENESPAAAMDALLRRCLLAVLARAPPLPLKSSLLYRNYLIEACPEGRTLDVKKSSYKKIGKFLNEMQKEGLVEVKEIEKGVDALVAVNSQHPEVRAAARAPAAPSAPAPAPAAPGGYVPPTVREVYCVTAAVLPLFAPVKKGTPLAPAEVRATLTEYVRSRQLQQRGGVQLDALLAGLARRPEQEVMKWEELMSLVTGLMTAGAELSFGAGPARLCKARLEPIKMQVVTRSGNKKVTLVSNLESFGFRLAALGAEWQRGAAAAVGVTRAPGAAADQLLLQGDQTHFVARALVERFGLPKKYVEGADRALRKKNK